jgi:hypothetical protein
MSAAAARKQHEAQGFGSAQFTTSTPNPQYNFEGVDYSIVRARANRANKELLTLCHHRLETGAAINWNRAAYMWARHLRLFKAGVYRDTRGKNWTKYKKQYFFKWLAPTQANFFAWLKTHAPTDAQREAVESGIRSALGAKAKGFVCPERAADMLNVTMAERTVLRLTTIGAIDCNLDQRREIAMLKKRIADRARAAAKRAEAGARPHSEGYAAVQPWEEFGMSRRTFFRLDADERAAMLEHAIKEVGTKTSQATYTDDIDCDELVPRPEPAPEDSKIVTIYSIRPPRIFTVFGGSITVISDTPTECQRATAPMAAPANEPIPPSIADAERIQHPVDAVARKDWWLQPVEGWRDGRLTIANMLTGESRTINTRTSIDEPLPYERAERWIER